MLYLIESMQKMDGEWYHCLKIGHSDKTKSRKNGYITHQGPNFDEQVIGKKHGNKMFERMYQVKFRNLAIIRKVTGRRNEWCIYSKKMYDSFFNDTIESLGEFLWKNKTIYLDPYRKNKGKVRKVYEYLRSIYAMENTDLTNNNKDKDINNEEDKLISRCLNYCISNKVKNSY